MPLPPFQQVLDAHAREVHRFLVASVGRVDADDCFQETWIAALRAYPRVHDASNLRAWIFTIAHHKAIDHARRRRREPVPVAALPDQVADSRDEPDAALWQRVRELPPKQRTALTLRFVVDAAYSDIASAMHTSVEAARRSVHEGLKRLRTEYSHE